MSNIKENNEFQRELITRLAELRETCLKISKNVNNPEVATKEVFSLHNKLTSIAKWLVGNDHGENAVALLHFGLFTSLLSFCGVSGVIASTVPAAMFLGPELLIKIKEYSGAIKGLK